MILTKQQREQFERACGPLMDWLVNNCHPHVTVIVDSQRAELVEGVASIMRRDDDNKESDNAAIGQH